MQEHYSVLLVVVVLVIHSVVAESETRCILNANEKPFILKDVDAQNNLMRICPDLYNSTAQLTCCDTRTVSLLSKEYKGNLKTFSSCPACIHNFYKFQCTFLCSPNVNKFVTRFQIVPVRSIFNTRGQRLEIDFQISKEYIDAVYESCAEHYSIGCNSIDPFSDPRKHNKLCKGAEWFEFTINHWGPLNMEHIERHIDLRHDQPERAFHADTEECSTTYFQSRILPWLLGGIVVFVVVIYCKWSASRRINDQP